MKLVNLLLRSVAVLSAVGEFRDARRAQFDAIRALQRQFTLLEWVLVYVPLPTLPDDLESKRREIKRDVAALMRGDSAEALEAYYGVVFRTLDLLKEAGVSAPFLASIEPLLKVQKTMNIELLDALAAQPQPDDKYVQGTNMSAIERVLTRMVTDSSADIYDKYRAH